ncbi:MAG: lysophospholipid acyltransferase family protein [Hyphomicrobiales bacterium]|nr:lysophospholipid acyltransferase family protein [Hyphomicrobiales bacterium]MDE2114596.1 lysophospholipid acyltransferase family protein [Hyphomicrobiales bacterium]
MKKLGRSPFVQELLGWLLERYLAFVAATTRFSFEPADMQAIVGRDAPVILAFWHGQQFLLFSGWPKSMKLAALISRHGDGGINAAILRRQGVIPVRGSGGNTSHKVRHRGGAVALREMLRVLEGGTSMALTADVPKVARQVGLGVVTLARLSGRPIYPVAVVSARRIDFNSWDRASFPKPFGRGAMVLGEPIRVARETDAPGLEVVRGQVEAALDIVQIRACAMVGTLDPGQVLNVNRPASQTDSQTDSQAESQAG